MVTVEHHRIIKRRSVGGAGLLLATFLAAGLLVPACYQIDEKALSNQEEPEVLDYVALDGDQTGKFSSADSKNPAFKELEIHGQWYAYGDRYGNPRSCIDVGHHQEENCSLVNYPPNKLPKLGFPNFERKMCVSGIVAQLLTCCEEEEKYESECESECGCECKSECKSESEAECECHEINGINCDPDRGFDDSNMWGAGIGFDLGLNFKNLEKGTDDEGEEQTERKYKSIHDRSAWDATVHKVKGISFELEWHATEANQTGIPMRIEFPMKITNEISLPTDKGTARLNDIDKLTFICDDPEFCGTNEFTVPASTEEHSYGSPFWQSADATQWGPSPLVQGLNTVLWENVRRPPEDDRNYLELGETLDPTQLMGVQFHVIPDEGGKKAIPFSFCISDIRFLKE